MSRSDAAPPRRLATKHEERALQIVARHQAAMKPTIGPCGADTMA
jgi:hypothetical protein